MALLNKQARRDIRSVVRDIEKLKQRLNHLFKIILSKPWRSHKSDPYAKLAAAVALPARILTDEDAPALAGGRRRRGRRRTAD